MPVLRRLAAPLAVLLALVVAGEVTDLVPCGDADCGVWGVVFGDGVPAGGAPTGAGGPTDAPDTACLCHAQFVAAVAAPGVPVPSDVSGDLHPAVTARPASGVADVPHPPPLG